MIRRIVVAFLVILTAPMTLAEHVRLKAGTTDGQMPSSASAFVAYYWRAKPGHLDAYNEYIRSVAILNCSPEGRFGDQPRSAITALFRY